MLIIKIAPLPNGAHNNQTCPEMTVPPGWARVPEDLGTAETLENFPFGEIEVENIGGAPTVTRWTPRPVPEAETEPAPEEQNARLRAQVTMLQEQQVFLEDCLLEMAEEVYA